MEHEDNKFHGPAGDDGGDQESVGNESLWLWTAREFLAILLPWQSCRGKPRAVGDGGLQTPTAVIKWGSLQAHRRHINQLQEHCFEGCQWVEAVMKRNTAVFWTSLQFVKLANDEGEISGHSLGCGRNTFFPLIQHRMCLTSRCFGFFRTLWAAQEPNSGFCLQTCSRRRILFILHVTFARMLPEWSVLKGEWWFLFATQYVQQKWLFLRVWKITGGPKRVQVHVNTHRNYLILMQGSRGKLAALGRPPVLRLLQVQSFSFLIVLISPGWSLSFTINRKLIPRLHPVLPLVVLWENGGSGWVC